MPTHTTDLPAILGGAPLFPDGPPSWPLRDEAVAASLQEAFADGSWGRYHGPRVAQLAEMLAAYHETQFAVLCASGTAAVELALRGLKVGPGDEVVLAAYDFKGNFQNVITVGATPVLVDVHPDNWNLNVEQLAAAVTPATKAVLVSHLHGGIVPMPEVVRVAREHGLPVIEDACQMPGARLHGKIAGTWGDVGILSFGGSKLLTAGRGGALVTSDARIVQRIKLYTQRGNDAYPLSELQAAVLIPQLSQLDEANRRRAMNVALLCERVADIAGLQLFRNPVSDSHPGHYKLGFQYDAAALGGLSREDFITAVRAEGIALDAGFRALHEIHGSRRYRKIDDLPHATRADEAVLTLHHPVLLETEREMRLIAQAIERIAEHATRLSGQSVSVETG